jgi:prophage regulatory protein
MSGLSIWRLHEVMARTGLKRSTIYDKMKKGDFPLSVSLGPRAVGWIADEVIAWINEQIDRSRNGR